MLLTDRTVPSRQTFFTLRRTAELSSDWLIGVRRLLHCAVFVIAAQCDWFSSALCFSSPPVAFVIAACRVYHRSLFCLLSLLVAFLISACRVCYRCLSLLLSLPVLFGAVSFCGVSCSCFLVDFHPCPLVCVGMLSRRCLLSVRLAAS